ncbi:ABC transporter permease [Specibacter cremeus]|uniref:ABC transporter permease n=1 Tax=Specibacter cremeus TaxID=1629051 RepID=UPI000F78EF48|nr:ABC transporter permease [Specibacter cremeus]
MNPWLKFVSKRLAGLVVVFFAASFLVFSLLYLAPGSPISFLLGNRSGTPEQIAAIRAQYHLDDPFLTRYAAWLGGILHGDLGQSIVYRQDVAALIGARIPTTAALVGYASVIILIVGVAIGLLAALRPGWVDATLRGGMTVALSTPPFVVGVLLILVFALSLGWFPVFGAGRGFADTVWHLTLPALALAGGGAAFLGRITRAATRGELARDHVETARARGLGESRVITRHVVRNALIPVVTVAGLTVASLVAGAVVVESVFAVDGLGSLLVRAILQRDFVVVQALVLLLVVTFIVINTIVDVIYLLVDPRIKA